jgi:hypothetical protein
MNAISGIITYFFAVIRLKSNLSDQYLRSAMLDLERKCGELTGSNALQNARKAIEIRRQLPSTSDLCALAELIAGLVHLFTFYACPNTAARRLIVE